MTDLISSAIRELEKRKAALETALEALAGIDGTPEVPDTIASTQKSVRRKPYLFGDTTEPGRKVPFKRSAATRKKMRDAALARYAAKRAEADRAPF